MYSYLNMAHRLKQFCFSFAAKPPPPPRKCVIYFSYNSSSYYYSLSSRHAFDYFDSVVTFKMVWVLDNLNYHNFPSQLVGAHGQNGVRA